MLHGKLMTHIYYRTGAMDDRSFTCRTTDFQPFWSFDLDLDPMTFMYEIDSYSLKVNRICKYELATPRL